MTKLQQQMKKANRNAQKGAITFTKSIITTLRRAGRGDENISRLEMMCKDAAPIDLSAIDINAVYQDPKVQTAFKTFICGQLGTMQMFDESWQPPRRSVKGRR